MAQPTPGQWQTDDAAGFPRDIVDDNGKTIACAYRRDHWPGIEQDPQAVCNARLMARAKDMRDLLAEGSSAPWSTEWVERVRKLLQALKCCYHPDCASQERLSQCENYLCGKWFCEEHGDPGGDRQVQDVGAVAYPSICVSCRGDCMRGNYRAAAYRARQEQYGREVEQYYGDGSRDNDLCECGHRRCCHDFGVNHCDGERTPCAAQCKSFKPTETKGEQ